MLITLGLTGSFTIRQSPLCEFGVNLSGQTERDLNRTFKELFISDLKNDIITKNRSPLTSASIVHSIDAVYENLRTKIL